MVVEKLEQCIAFAFEFILLVTAADQLSNTRLVLTAHTVVQIFQSTERLIEGWIIRITLVFYLFDKRGDLFANGAGALVLFCGQRFADRIEAVEEVGRRVVTVLDQAL